MPNSQQQAAIDALNAASNPGWEKDKFTPGYVSHAYTNDTDAQAIALELNDQLGLGASDNLVSADLDRIRIPTEQGERAAQILKALNQLMVKRVIA